MDGVPLVRLAAVRGGGPVFPSAAGGDGALLLGRGVLPVRGVVADGGGALGCHAVVRLDRRDAVAGVAQAVVLVDGMGGGVQSAGKSLEGGVIEYAVKFVPLDSFAFLCL